MKQIPGSYFAPCARAGRVESLSYGEKHVLVYLPEGGAGHILYLIHGGGGDQRSFFRDDFLHMIDHMTADALMEPMYIVSPCFYDPGETDKTPASSGIAVKKFCAELRDRVIPLAEDRIGTRFRREDRAISGFSMGGVTTWYAFLQAPDLFSRFLPLSGDCWVCGEKGGGKFPEETAAKLAEAAEKQSAPDYRIHAITGSRDIAFPNLDAQIRAMRAYPDLFGEQLRYDVLEGGVHDYETIFRYLYNALPGLFSL